jgi:hypothetical protein
MTNPRRIAARVIIVIGCVLATAGLVALVIAVATQPGEGCTPGTTCTHGSKGTAIVIGLVLLAVGIASIWRAAISLRRTRR